MFSKKSFNKYLEKRSFIQYAKTSSIPKKKYYEKFIVIPCYDEFDFIFKTLDSINNQNLSDLENTLIIIVINNSEEDSQTVKTNNQKTYNALMDCEFNFELTLIDCFSKKNMFKKKIGGVGAARKTGLDFALKYAKNRRSLLCSLDADTIISENYLSIIDKNFKEKNINAATVNFRHQYSDNPIINEGIRKYEILIKEIANNIKKAGSPYGYVSLGSTIICNAQSYLACGGMSKKKATEDFYFLQALAKYSNIFIINDILVFPSSRDAQRVYLGTGFRMKEYGVTKNFNNLTFSKNSFKSIEKIISIVNANWNNDFNMFKKNASEELKSKVFDFLISQDIKKIWKNFQDNSQSKKQFMLFFHQWFDALMIIHLLKKLNN